MGWFGKNKRIRQKQLVPLYLDGSSSWRVQSWPQEAEALLHVPVDAEIVLEAIPQSTPDKQIVLFYNGVRVAHFYPGRYADSLWGAITAANQAGYQVLLHSKRIQPGPPPQTIDTGRKVAGYSVVMSVGRQGPEDAFLEVRSALAADLEFWLSLPPEERARGFVEVRWMPTNNEHQYEGRPEALLGPHRHSLILQCTFWGESRESSPYRDQLPPEASAKAKKGTVADIHAAGIHIGEVRDQEAIQNILNGSVRGLARIEYWSGRMQTKVQVCVPDPDGVFPEYEGPFMWQAQKRAIREAEREKKRSQ